MLWKSVTFLWLAGWPWVWERSQSLTWSHITYKMPILGPTRVNLVSQPGPKVSVCSKDKSSFGAAEKVVKIKFGRFWGLSSVLRVFSLGLAPKRWVVEWPRWILGMKQLKLLQNRKTSCRSLLSIKSCLYICVYAHAHVFTHGSTGPGAQRAARRAGMRPDASWGVGSGSWAAAHRALSQGAGARTQAE